MNVFCKAAKIIRKRGWKQGISYSENGPVCILQALALARGSSPWNLPDKDVYGDKGGYGTNNYGDPAVRDATTLGKYIPEWSILRVGEIYPPIGTVWSFNDVALTKAEGKAKVLQVLDAACIGEG